MVTWVLDGKSQRLDKLTIDNMDTHWSIQHDCAEKLDLIVKAERADIGFTVGFIQLVTTSIRRGTYLNGTKRIVELPGTCLDGCRDGDDDISPWYDMQSHAVITAARLASEPAFQLSAQDRPELRLPKVYADSGTPSPLVKAYAKEEFLLSLVVLKTEAWRPELAETAIMLGQWTWGYEHLCTFSGKSRVIESHREQHLQPVRPSRPLALADVLLGPAGEICEERWTAPPPAVQTAQDAATDCGEALSYPATPATH